MIYFIVELLMVTFPKGIMYYILSVYLVMKLKYDKN